MSISLWENRLRNAKTLIFFFVQNKYICQTQLDTGEDSVQHVGAKAEMSS